MAWQELVWQELYGNWILIPPRPVAIIHFLGGAFVATAPQVTYRGLLEFLASQGYAIVATPFVNTLDHTTIAQRVMRVSNLALDAVSRDLGEFLPIYGMGHSMGCKLHLLIGSLFPQERDGNILISFNNYPAKRSIPMVEQFSQVSKLAAQFANQLASQVATQLNTSLPPQFAANFEVEFTPSPEETNRLIVESYQVPRNLLIKFSNDDIDQTRSLDQALQQRFPEFTTVQILKGTHLTPLGQEVSWQAGKEFTPFDAVGQFLKQELTRDINQLKRSILNWLDSPETLQA